MTFSPELLNVEILEPRSGTCLIGVPTPVEKRCSSSHSTTTTNVSCLDVVLPYRLTISRSGPTQSQAQAATTSTFVTALVFNAAVFGGELLAFTLLRNYFKTIYEPRTFLTPKKCVQTIPLRFTRTNTHGPSKRVPPLPQRLFSWPLALWNSDPEIVRKQNGLDAYMFLRFLRSESKSHSSHHFLFLTFI